MTGRPRGFGADHALERTIEGFWDQGFTGTSVVSLQERIGVKRGSFYAAFEDTERAWRLALDRYAGTITEAAFERLGAPGDVSQRLGRFIASSAASSPRTAAGDVCSSRRPASALQ